MRWDFFRILGIVLIIIAVALFFIVNSYSGLLREKAAVECQAVHGHDAEVCPIANSSFIPVEGYIGYSLVILILASGILLLFYPKKTQQGKIGKTQKEIKSIIKKLDKEEKKIYNLIIDHKGTIFQSEIAEKTGLNKVKITRILDRLQGKQLVERKRRGMTNVIILK